MPLIIILVECGIELIPKEIRNHSAIRKNLSSQIYSSQILDNALHHSAMNKLKNSEKRGRPDITHLCLLNALGSTLNKTGNLNVFIHTIKNRIYEFNSEIRIARNYNRFKGLMAKVLIDGNIKVNGKQLISQYEGKLHDLIDKFKNPETILLSSRGKLVNNYRDLFPEALSKNIIAVIGGFQKNAFSEEVLRLSNKLFSISEYSLDAWVVINKIITYYELSHNIQ
jgi:rRNA small subunit pseudouridine methyltransferase Nep1